MRLRPTLLFSIGWQATWTARVSIGLLRLEEEIAFDESWRGWSRTCTSTEPSNCLHLCWSKGIHSETECSDCICFAPNRRAGTWIVESSFSNHCDNSSGRLFREPECRYGSSKFETAPLRHSRRRNANRWGDLIHPAKINSGANLEVRRPLVNKWSLDSASKQLANLNVADGDTERGATLFRAVQCIACHRMKGRGGVTGPDLSSVASRFSQQDILASIIEPSRVISEKYQSVQIVTSDGKSGSGTGCYRGRLSLVRSPLGNQTTSSQRNPRDPKIRDRISPAISHLPDARGPLGHPRCDRDTRSTRLPDEPRRLNG